MRRTEDKTEGADDASPSKSQIKRELKALQALGERLAALPMSQCRKLPLGPRTLETLEELGRIHAHGARRRQLRLLGKRLRDEDAEAVVQALTTLQAPDKAQIQLEKACERWRERLLDKAAGGAALSAFIERFPGVERSRLRQLVRNAIAERAADKPPAAQRKLFRYLREVIAMTENPS